MMKCWKAMVRSVGGGGWHLSQEHSEGYTVGIGKTREGASSSVAAAEQSMTSETFLGQVLSLA